MTNLKNILSCSILLFSFFALPKDSIAQTNVTPKSSEINFNQVAEPQFSKQRGFYESSFDVVISTSVNQAVIKYTLDGSDPAFSLTAITNASPVTVRINPDSTYGVRGKNAGVTLRACVVTSDSLISKTQTHTYLFINKVTSLSPDGVKPGSGWPNPTTSGQQSIDYGMDPEIYNDIRYTDLIDDALLSIPTISVVTDLKNLFQPDSGIYMNAYQDGINWERPASIELLNPDGSAGFQVNAGIRIRGGASRSGANPKHAFRLFFRSVYGDSKLNFPLFENEGVDTFDKVDLRTSQNYSWSFPGHQGEYNTMNRDVFSRDLQGMMKQPYTKSRYYHLYIDGYYWGIYQTEERPEAKFAVSYFGGSEEDYDVVKSDDSWPPHIEVTDGNLDAYQEIWNYCVTGFQDNVNYFKLQGLNPDGSANPSYKKLVDIDNLIDFMLIIFYTGNFDSPTTIWSNNKNPRNFFCIYNRNRNDGFKFIIHDAEHTLRTTSGEHPATVGLYENRVNIGSLSSSNPYLMTVTSFNNLHPQWLHFKLSENPEYRIRFADRVYKHFFNEGSITTEKVTQLFQNRAQQIETAIIGESARWGDTYHSPARNKFDDWLPAVEDILYNYFPYRGTIVLNQFKGANLFPTFNPPLFKINDVEIKSEILNVEPGFVIKIQKPSGINGTIYYTTDGNDPREIGGNISSTAVSGGDSVGVTINSTTILKARIKNGTKWSALHKVTFFAGNETGNIKVTEIHYHPLDGAGVENSEYEFLELKNIGSTPVNLSEAKFVKGITYNFPSDVVLNPQEFYVIAANIDEFNNRYNFFPSAEYTGKLDNAGENITLLTVSGDTIFSITYDDKYPWPEQPDGSGYSLVTKEINPTGNLNDPNNWRASYQIHGSPGKDDLPTPVEIENELPATIELLQNYPNPFNPSTTIQYALNSVSNVHLAVYDVLGREISVLVNETQQQGFYKINFSNAELASGVYFCKLKTDQKTLTKKMLYLK